MSFKPNIDNVCVVIPLINTALLALTAHISSPVSVVQVNTTVSPGHTLSDDESSVTEES